MEKIILTQNEEKSLIQIFSLLKDTHSARKTETVNDARDELNTLQKDIISFTKLIIKGLSISKIRNQEISLELHKSLLIYLKNTLIINQRIINDSEIYNILEKIFNLMLTINDNENIQNDSMILLFNNLVKTLCDNNNSLMENIIYSDKLLKLVLDKIKAAPDKDFLYIAKNGLGLICCLLPSNSIGKNNYLDLIQKYLIPVGSIIFSKVCLYIIPNNNVYTIEFIDILKDLYETFYIVLLKLKRFFPSLKRKEVADEIFKIYGKYTYEIIQIVPFCDEDTKSKFGEANPILVFNEEYQQINLMKANAFQFMSLIIEYSTMSSIIEDNNDSKNYEDKKNVIDNKDLVDISSKLITLIIKCLEDILNEEKKFNYLRRIDDDRSDEENYHNLLLYQIIDFLKESLTKEPIKSEFYQHIKLFLLNALFPLLTTVDSEKSYMRCEPEEYCAYFNDLVYTFSLKNFRIYGFFLIKKIAEEYIDIANFILSYIIGMTNDIMNKGINNQNINNNIDNISNQFNAYYYYKPHNVLIDKFNEEIKLDFCLLILIILQKQLLKYDILNNKLREVLIKTEDKFGQIKDPLIRIKFCHLFKFIIPNLFSDNNDEDDEDNISNNYNNNMNKIIENDISYNSLIEKALSFLFNNLTQTKSEDYLIDCLYYHSLGNEASITIISLFKFIQTDNKSNLLKNKLNDLFQIYFNSLLDLIDIISLYSFFTVIEEIIKNIKINNRQDLFNCLNKLTKRFVKEFETGDINSQTYCPMYFSILSSLFNGVNKLSINSNNNNKSELEVFKELYKPALEYMNDIFRFIYYENLVKAMIDYIKNYKGIDEQCAIVLKSMFLIIENDRTFSLTSYNYVSIFLNYLENDISTNIPINEEQLFQTIIEIIEKAFSIDPDQYDFSNLYALLLTLQIYSKNMNITEKIQKILLSNSLKCFNYIFDKDEKNGTAKSKKEKDIVIFGIFALGYIFKPEQTHNLLEQLEIIQQKQKERFYEEIENEPFNFNKYIHILSYINEFEIENELLRKCLILGFCSLIKMAKLQKYLNDNKNIKVNILKIFVNFILIHKSEDIKKRNKLMKEELKIKKNEDGKINFENLSDTDDEEEENENENILDKNINFSLESNKNIKNSNEYQFFKDSLDYIKQNDPESINMLYKELSPEKIKQLEDVYHITKFKVNYQGKELEIPRRILNINRNGN